MARRSHRSHRRSHRSHRSHRRSHHSHRRRRSYGGGFATGPDFLSAGNPVIHPYTGSGKDCPADQPLHRDGYITPSSYLQKGLPGMNGGTRLLAADSFSYGEASSPIRPPVVPSPQKGGAYGTVLGALNPSNGVGGSAIPSIQSIPCALRYPGPMRGGGQGADMLTYQAQNAGYSNQPVIIPGGAVPGFMSQVGYPAGSFNRACLTTGGGNAPLAVAPVMNPSAEDIVTRKDFDGTDGPLPVRGGRRRRHRSRRQKQSRRRHSRRQ